MKKKRSDRSDLAQTLLPPPVMRWVREEAKREGLTVAAWLRRLVLRAKGDLPDPANAAIVREVREALEGR